MKKYIVLALVALMLFGCAVSVSAATDEENPGTTPPTELSSYEAIFALLHEHIYGNAELTVDQNLTLTQLSTLFCVLLVFMPFLVVLFVLKTIFGR